VGDASSHIFLLDDISPKYILLPWGEMIFYKTLITAATEMLLHETLYLEFFS